MPLLRKPEDTELNRVITADPDQLDTFLQAGWVELNDEEKVKVNVVDPSASDEDEIEVVNLSALTEANAALTEANADLAEANNKLNAKIAELQARIDVLEADVLPDGEAKSLEDMNTTQLRDLAKEKGIAIPTATSKVKIIELIRAANPA